MIKNKKKLCLLIISVITIQILFMNLNLNNVLGYQTEDDLETTINAELNSNTLEMKGSALMTTGTHSFYETPELDIGGFEHDITSIDVLNIQAPTFKTTISEGFQIADTEQPGTYPGTYSFTDDDLGSNPDEWSITETVSSDISVIDMYQGHGHVVELYDPSTGYAQMNNELSDIEDGTIEFWFNTPDKTKSAQFYLYKDSTIVLYLIINSIPGIINNEWHHLRIDFNCETDSFDLYLDQNIIYDDQSFYNSALNIDLLKFITTGANPSTYYIDAVDYSWSLGYYLNRNFNAIGNNFLLSDSIDEYTCDGGLDTIISVNADYQSNDNDVIELLNDDFTGDQWELYDMSSTTIQYSTSLDRDAYVWTYHPTTNYGSSEYLNVDDGSEQQESYIGATIPYFYESTYSNSLLYFYEHTTGGPGYIWVYTTSYFNEYSITWSNKPSHIAEVGVQYIDGIGWKSISLNQPYLYYALTSVPGSSPDYHNIYSRESGTPPYITHYLNKIYQNTGSGYFYMQTATNQETVNVKSPVYGTTTYVTAGDHIILDCQTTSSEQLKLRLWKDGEVVKEYNIFDYGNTNYARHDVDITVDEYLEFDQMSINGKFDNTEYFKCWDITVNEHVGKNWFKNCYIEDFTYNVLGQNYTEDFELVLDEDNSVYNSSEGNYVFYFDSSMFSNRDEMDDVIIHSQTLNLTLTMNIERDVNITVDASYSSNSWVVPSVVGLKINGEEVSDESTNSGFCALGNFPENLVITSTSQCYFRLDITSLFSFTFDLDVISKTYLKKSFQLESNHDINLTSIIFPETLWIKKIYLNNIDHDDDNPLTLNPKVQMATTSIFKLEVITYGEIYIPLDQETEGESYILYSENFGTDTSEMYHSYFFNEYEHDYSIDGNLYMSNEFPSAFYEENWSGWDLDYDPDYTNSSFSNGTFSSSLNEYTNTSIPEQPGDFDLINGSSTFSGDLSSIDDNYTSFTSTAPGHYPATYSFTDDEDGSDPSCFTLRTGNMDNFQVVASEGYHSKVYEVDDDESGSSNSVWLDYDDSDYGTIEFWYLASSYSGPCGIYMVYGTSGIQAYIYAEAGTMYVYDAGGANSLGSISLDTWYHFRIDFEATGGLYMELPQYDFSVRINELLIGIYDLTFNEGLIKDAYGSVISSAALQVSYWDAIGYSWFDNYSVGDNLNSSIGSLNFTTTFQLDAEPFQELKDIMSIELFYSLKINTTQEVNISIYNFINSTYDLINSSYNFNNFNLLSYSINQSCNINESRSIQFKFETSNITSEFHLDLEVFKIIIAYVNDSDYNNANITKIIDLDFLTEFDGPQFDDYQKIYNVSISVYYRFTSNFSDLTYNAYFNNTELNNNTEWVNLQYNFVFNTTGPGDPDNFTLLFNITNGILEINEMNYTIEFKCINLNNEYQIYQYFKLSPDFSITSNDITKEMLFLNFTCNFTATPFTDLIYNNSITNNIFSCRINILSESGWVYQDLGFNTTTSQYVGMNLTSILHDNNQTTFNDINIEFYLSGHESSLSVDTLNISILTSKIQLTEAPRTDINSVEFQEPMLASRSYTYWYFENSYTINDASLEDVETSEIITSFNIEGSQYFFQESFYGGDLILGLIDYNPGWDVSYEVLINNGTYTRMRIDYSADFTINNVNIVLNLKNEGILNDNWTLGTQDSYTFKLTIPGINFTSTTQSFYIEGYSTIPYAVMSSYESDQNWNRIITENEIDYAGYLTYPKYTQVFLLNKSVDWTAYSVYYGGTIYSAETMNPSLVKVLGDGFDPDITDSYLYFRTSPFKSVDFEFDGAMITITINCSIDVEKAYFMYAFDPSGVHNLGVYSSNNSISVQGLSDTGDFEGYLYFACEKIYSGITQIKIAVNFATPLEMILQSVIIFVIAGIAIAGYYYIKRNEEKVEKLSKKIGAKLKEKLSRKKEEKGLKEISISIKDDKLYLEDKR